MIRFKQKEFWIGAALNAVGIGSSLLGLKQGQEQNEQLEENARQQAEQMRKHDELLQEQNRKLDRIAERAKRNPEAAIASARAVAQKEFGTPMSVLRPLAKMRSGLNSVKNLGSNVFKAGGIELGKGMAENVATGVTMAAAGYGVGKAIQHNMKKEGLDLDSNGNLTQKSYGVVGEFGKNLAKGLKKKSTWAMAAGFTAVPAYMGYMSDKQQLKDQVGATQPTQPTTQDQPAQQRSYTISGSIMKGIGKLKPNWWDFKKFRAHPGQTLSGFGANVASFGMLNTDKINKFGKTLEKLGTGGAVNGIKGVKSDAAVKAGQFIQNHKTLANTAGIAAGAGLASATWDGSQKLVNKIGRTVDPGAYKYQDAQNKKVELQQQQQTQ